MITLQQILTAKSSVLDKARVKVVRHKDNRPEYKDVMKDKKQILEYQKIQGKDIFKDCDYIVSFIGIERGRSVFLGVFKVGASYMKDGVYEYELENVPEFREFEDRLIIDWGGSTISWHQWYDKQPKEVIEILPEGYIGHFPGLLSFVLDFKELKDLIENPSANYEWYHHLSAVNGVYMILDSQTGEQYIGSANGQKGIWQRWSEYAQNKTGGNKELKILHETDPDYCRHFRFSILQTLPSNITKSEIDFIESLYKEKLGSRAHGLNHN